MEAEIKEGHTLDISCVILAGGKSLRLGRDKIVENVGKKSLLQRAVSTLGSFNRDIIIVTAQGQSLTQFTDRPGLKIVDDIYPGKGSLGGIYTGIVTPTEAAVVAIFLGLFIGFVLFRKLKIKDLRGIFIRSAEMSAMILLIFGFAYSFGWLLALFEVPDS